MGSPGDGGNGSSVMGKWVARVMGEMGEQGWMGEMGSRGWGKWVSG